MSPPSELLVTKRAGQPLDMTARAELEGAALSWAAPTTDGGRPGRAGLKAARADWIQLTSLTKKNKQTGKSDWR